MSRIERKTDRIKENDDGNGGGDEMQHFMTIYCGSLSKYLVGPR